MPEYDNSNRGALFRVKEKKNERGPDYEGNLDVEGVAYRVAGWIKESKTGMKFMSLSIKVKEEIQPAPTRTTDRAAEEDSDIPF